MQALNMGICNSKRAIRLDDGGVLLADDSFEVRRMELVNPDMMFSFVENLLLVCHFCFTHLLSFRRYSIPFVFLNGLVIAILDSHQYPRLSCWFGILLEYRRA